MLRRLRIVFLVLAGLFGAAFGTLVLLANVYDAEVKVKLVGALNERLNAPVSVSDMDLTFIARFPRASIRLKDVLAREVRYDSLSADTLLYAEELFLEFSLWDMFQGTYTVQSIHGRSVRLYPALDAEGRENFLTAGTGGRQCRWAHRPLPRCRQRHADPRQQWFAGAQRPFQRCREPAHLER
jgi:hypothetical protein